MLDHRRRAAHEDEAVRARGGQVGPGHFGVDEAAAVVPALCRRSVEGVPEVEALRVLGTHLLQLLAEENVSVGLVGVEEPDAGAVILVLEDLADDLQHGGDARSAGDHANLRGDEKWYVGK